MNEIKKALNKYNIRPTKYIKMGKQIIAISKDQKVAIKSKTEKDINELYEYLNSRSFIYHPNIISNEEDSYDIEEYIYNVNSPEEQKTEELMNLLGMLHLKTTHYINIDLDEIKKKYEETKEKLKYLYNYYSDVSEIIESKVHMSPSEYLLIRNISLIFNVINYCNFELEEWYKIKKENKKERVATIHGNPDISHILINDKSYLVSWNDSRIDLPIYDFVEFYNKNYENLDYGALLNAYEAKYPLSKDEKKLMMILLSIPEKLELEKTEYKNCKKITTFINKIYRTEKLISLKRPNELKSQNKQYN